MNFTLTMIRMVGESDWDLPPETYAALVKAEEEQTPIEVLCLAVANDTPACSYYDIKLADGTTVDAVQGYHILGIDDWEKPPVHITAQYVVELKFGPNILNGAVAVDHSGIEAIIASALNRALQTFCATTGREVSLENVAFETDYPTPEEK